MTVVKMKNKHYTYYYIRNAFFLMFVEVLLVLIFASDPLPKILGVFLGTLVSSLFFRVIYLNIVNMLEKPEKEAKRYMRMNYFFRYIIYGLIMVLAIKADYLDLLMTVLGLLSIKFVIYLQNFWELIREKIDNK